MKQVADIGSPHPYTKVPYLKINSCDFLKKLRILHTMSPFQMEVAASLQRDKQANLLNELIAKECVALAEIQAAQKEKGRGRPCTAVANRKATINKRLMQLEKGVVPNEVEELPAKKSSDQFSTCAHGDVAHHGVPEIIPAQVLDAAEMESKSFVQTGPSQDSPAHGILMHPMCSLPATFNRLLGSLWPHSLADQKSQASCEAACKGGKVFALPVARSTKRAASGFAEAFTKILLSMRAAIFASGQMQPPGGVNDWCTLPDKRRWLGVRVAWPFGKQIYAGTVSAWKRDLDGRRFVWRVSYDDGDEEVYSRSQVYCGIRMYRAVEKSEGSCPKVCPAQEHQPKDCQVTPATTLTQQLCVPKRRAVVRLEMPSSARTRLCDDLDQGLFPFPVLISPRRLLPLALATPLSGGSGRDGCGGCEGGTGRGVDTRREDDSRVQRVQLLAKQGCGDKRHPKRRASEVVRRQLLSPSVGRELRELNTNTGRDTRASGASKRARAA